MVSNHLELRWLKTVVVSVEEKAVCESRQVGTGKTNVSEPLLKRRDLGSDIETGVSMQSRDESGGCPSYWPGGVRRAGGVSPVCGCCAERGKARVETDLRPGAGWWREGAYRTAETGGAEYRRGARRRTGS